MKGKELIPSSSPPRHEPWNQGKLLRAKLPLRASHVWSIRTKLQLEKRTRDLALFNLAIDSKLRGAMSSRCAAMMWLRIATRWSSNCPAEEDGSSGPVRANRADAASRRRVSQSHPHEARRLPVCRSR
jgi:hypothetical protein